MDKLSGKRDTEPDYKEPDRPETDTVFTVFPPLFGAV